MEELKYRNLLLFAYLQLRKQKGDRESAKQDPAGGRNRSLINEVSHNLPGMVKTDDKLNRPGHTC